MVGSNILSTANVLQYLSVGCDSGLYFLNPGFYRLKCSATIIMCVKAKIYVRMTRVRVAKAIDIVFLFFPTSIRNV